MLSKNIYQDKKILVTGASSGIGLEFAKILNRYNCILILTALDIELLERIRNDLLKQGRAEICCFTADLGKIDNLKKFYQILEEKNLVPDILINNAGRQSYGYFHKLNWQDEYEQVILNSIAPMYLMRQAIPYMIQNNFGRILNVSSIAGTMPNPFFATYAATKAFLNSFSQAISEEMHSKNIKCAVLLPGSTNCPVHWDLQNLMEKVGDISRFASPVDVAKYGLKLLEKNKDYGVHGLRNKITQFIKRFTPRSFLNYLLRKHTYTKSLEN